MYINVPLVNGCFSLSLSASQKMVLLAMAVGSFDGKYDYTPSLPITCGCSYPTVRKSIVGLIDRGVVQRTHRGSYRMCLQGNDKKWVNTEHFSKCMELTLPYNEKLVLLAVVKHISGKTGKCFPKAETISVLSGMTKRNVRRVLKALQEKKILERDTQGNLMGWTVKYVPPGQKHLSGEQKDLSAEQKHLSPMKKYKKEEEGVLRKGVCDPDLLLPTEMDTMRKPFISKINNGQTAKDVVKQVMGKKQKDYPNTPQGFLKAWRDGLAVHHDMPMMQTHLTDTNVANLKYIYKVGKDFELVQVEAFSTAIQNWAEFISYVTSMEGLQSAPMSPTIPWLTKYANSIYLWVLTKDKDDTVQLIAKPKLSHSSSDQVTKVLSVEEMKKKFKLGEYDD